MSRTGSHVVFEQHSEPASAIPAVSENQPSYLSSLIARGLPHHIADRVDRRTTELAGLVRDGRITYEQAQEWGAVAVLDAVMEMRSGAVSR